MADIKQQVGSLIREARIRKGLTQAEAGERMGVSATTFNRYESGNQNLTIETLFKIASVLGVDLLIQLNG